MFDKLILMLFDNSRQKATPGSKSICPCCRTGLIAKCGDTNVWHWAHESLIDCDPWYEGMSEWHLSWQGLVEEKCREVVIGEHRADIKLSDGKVVEIQHSPITPEEVEERESFYGDMIWIVDAKDFQKNLRMTKKISQRGFPYYSFKWKRARKGIVSCQKPVYFDFGENVFQVNGFKSYTNEGNWGEYTSHYGWGYYHEKDMTLYWKLFGEDYVG